MTKDKARLAVMGAISMALKNTTLQQGFEIICKNLAELENENAELKAQLENDRDLPAIAYMQGAEKQKKKDEELLTKAKKIIKDLCGMVRELNKPNVQLTNIDYSLSEAKQFLSEVENGKR